jgi:SAM-dependent methyltransferase
MLRLAEAAQVTGRAARCLRRSVPGASGAWHLAHALKDALLDDAERNRLEAEQQFERPDPWDYATSRAEQACLADQLQLLDRTRDGARFRRILEIGCAEGHFTEFLVDRADEVLAVDVSERALARARGRRRWENHVKFASWDLRRDPLPGTFDLVLAAGVLEYFRRPSAVRAASKKLVAALEPDGLLFLVTTRQPFAEDTWWGQRLIRGVWINAVVADHDDLDIVEYVLRDWYVMTLMRRRTP